MNKDVLFKAPKSILMALCFKAKQAFFSTMSRSFFPSICISLIAGNPDLMHHCYQLSEIIISTITLIYITKKFHLSNVLYFIYYFQLIMINITNSNDYHYSELLLLLKNKFIMLVRSYLANSRSRFVLSNRTNLYQKPRSTRCPFAPPTKIRLKASPVGEKSRCFSTCSEQGHHYQKLLIPEYRQKHIWVVSSNEYKEGKQKKREYNLSSLRFTNTNKITFQK